MAEKKYRKLSLKQYAVRFWVKYKPSVEVLVWARNEVDAFQLAANDPSVSKGFEGLPGLECIRLIQEPDAVLVPAIPD